MEVIVNPLLAISVVLTAGLSFLAVVFWSESRRKEREAYYRSEALKKIAEGPSGALALDFLREEEQLARRRRDESLRLGGLTLSAASVAFMIFLHVMISSNRPGVWTLGLIPLSVGLAVLAYSFFPSRGRRSQTPSDGRQ